jgi:hypothetical protein
MPATFPEMWLSRVIMLVSSLVSAPWLDGIPELDTQVVEIGEGTASEQNLIHIPIENFDVDVLINNSAYPIALQSYTDTEAVVSLDKYQTKVTTLSDDQTMGASYDKIDSATRAHVRGMLKNKYQRAIHALAPTSNTAATPVLAATGAPLTVGGRPTFVYEDLVALKDALDKNDTPLEGRRLVLSSEHMNDLLRDRDRFADKFVNHTTGQTAPVICGFEIYSYLGNPYYTTALAKVAFNGVPGATDRRASVCFVTDNVAKKTGNTKQYFAPSINDPENQTNRLAYRHYFMAVPVQAKWAGAIV